jgi:hypothetical protein
MTRSTRSPVLEVALLPTSGDPASTRRPLPSRWAAAGVTLVALIFQIVTGTSVASAAPAMVDPAGCSATLGRAAVWPGTVSGSTGTRRVFSDAYYTHLLRDPACAPLDN